MSENDFIAKIIMNNNEEGGITEKIFKLDINNERTQAEEFFKNSLKNVNTEFYEENIYNLADKLLNYYIDIKNNDSIYTIINDILSSNLNNKAKIKILNVTLTNNYLNNKYKINLLNFVINKLNNPEENNNNLRQNLKNIEEYKKKLLLNEEEKNKYILEQQEIININTQQINEDIKPLENAEKNIVSHITDTHGDSLAVLGSLKQTGFIGELTGEMLFYNIKDKIFYKLDEIRNLPLKNTNILSNNFVIIPDFKLPDKMPEGIFVHTGDIQDRGQESAESFVILRRVIDLYKEKYIEQGFNEEKAKEELINKIIITTSDHDNYGVSEINERKESENLDSYFVGAKNKFEKNFNKHHRIQEDMFIDGYINSGRLIQTNNKNLKILVNHSYVDANSVALVLMAVIFPYNEYIYKIIDKYTDINLEYITKLQNEFKKLEKNEKYKKTVEIFNKIKANIIKIAFKKGVNLNNINKNILNLVCNKVFKNCINSFKKTLNILFTILRYYIGIPVEGEEFNTKGKLTATEILEAFSMGIAAIDEMNRKKMKGAINDYYRHYNDPIIDLITFRNSRTYRGEGFMDPINGLKAAPIKGLLDEGIIVLNGHDVIKYTYNENIGKMLNIEDERKIIGNYPNDRNISYFYNNGQFTYIAPQIFKEDKNGLITNGIYNPLEIKRGNFTSKIYNEPNLESKKIESIFLIPEKEITNKLGAGTKESIVNISTELSTDIRNIIRDINNIQGQNANKNLI